MPTHIIQIGKHKFICGLFWQSLSRPRDLKNEAAELARKINSDLVVLRKDHAMAQAGYAHTTDGARRGMFSLAAIVSKTLAIEGANYDGHQQPVHNWLSAFKLPDGKWAYFAVRDANFLPNGDYAGTKEEVLERLHGDYGLGGWNVVIGDAELEEQGFHNFCAKRIEDLIPHKRDGQIRVHKWWALSQVDRKIPWKTIIGLGTVVAAAGAGGFAYWLHIQKEKAAEEERIRAAEIARQKKAGQPVPIIASHPWPKKPLPQALAQACVDRLSMFAPGGWQLEEYICTPEQVSYSWIRNGSAIEYLQTRVPNAVIDMSGDKATHVEILELATGKDEDLLPLKVIHPQVMSTLQRLGYTMKPGTLQGPPPPLPGSNDTNAPKQDWQSLQFTLTGGGIPPTELAEILSQPGIRLDKISFKAAAWSIEGVMYAK